MTSIPEFKITLKKQPKKPSPGYKPVSIRIDVYNQLAYIAEETGLALTDVCNQLLAAAIDLTVIEGEE